MAKHFVVLGLITLLQGCVGTPVSPPQERVSIYKSLGSAQCQPSSGVSMAVLQRQLEAADVKILSSSCGSNGRIYPAMCGAPDGRIAIFEIPPAQLSKTTALGFAPLSDLPDATRTACH